MYYISTYMEFWCKKMNEEKDCFIEQYFCQSWHLEDKKFLPNYAPRLRICTVVCKTALFLIRLFIISIIRELWKWAHMNKTVDLIDKKSISLQVLKDSIFLKNIMQGFIDVLSQVALFNFVCKVKVCESRFNNYSFIIILQCVYVSYIL